MRTSNLPPSSFAGTSDTHKPSGATDDPAASLPRPKRSSTTKCPKLENGRAGDASPQLVGRRPRYCRTLPNLQFREALSVLTDRQPDSPNTLRRRLNSP